jgi:hypothetical protein
MNDIKYQLGTELKTKQSEWIINEVFEGK